MSDIKPSVFPNAQQKTEAEERARLAAFEAEKLAATNEVYTNAASVQDAKIGHGDAIEAMRRRTEEQLRLREEVGIVQDPALAEQKKTPMTRNEYEIMEIRKKAEQQMKIRDEVVAKNVTQTQTYHRQSEEATVRNNNVQNTTQNMQTNNYQAPVASVQQPVKQTQSYGTNPSNINPYIVELSQPNYNSAFDVIPLPSQGKLYRTKKTNARVSFMTTADENILTSPNLLQSGEFLEILINRKVLESELRYHDLHVGDRNAIMIWLRATGYGEMYPVTLFDENNVPFDTEINLNELKVKNLGAEPDAEGLFDFQFPASKAMIKFKLLTCGDVDFIDKKIEQEKADGVPVNNTTTYKLEKTIVELNGSRDKNMIIEFANSIRIRDAKELTKYIDSIESGIDLNIEVRTPGGGSVATFLPLNVKFFWPDFGL